MNKREYPVWIRLLVIACIAIIASSKSYAVDYYVDANREQNGDGTALRPWKLWSDIDWAIIDTALKGDDVNIFFSATATWSSSSSFQPKSKGSASGTLSFIGNEKKNSKTTGASEWASVNGEHRATFTNKNGNGGQFTIGNGDQYLSLIGFRILEPTWGGVNLGTKRPTLNIRNILVEDCLIDSPVNNHGVWFGYAEKGCMNITVKDCIVRSTPLEGIYMGHYNYLKPTITGIVIEGNTLANCGLKGEGDIDIKPPCKGAIVSGNIHYSDLKNTSGKSCGVVIGADHCVVSGNRFYGMRELNGGWGGGIFLNAEGDTKSGSPISSCKIYNNVIYRNSRFGIKICTTCGEDISGVKLYNNTVTENGTFGIQIQQNGRGSVSVDLKNNILSDNKLADLSIVGHQIELLSDHNLYSRPEGLSWKWNNLPKTWLQWRALGFDVKGINKHPLFRNAATGDFRLSTKSPAYQAGVELNGVLNDNYHASMRGEHWNIGAFERGAISGERLTDELQ